MHNQEIVWFVARLAIRHYKAALTPPQIERACRDIGQKMPLGTVYSAMWRGERLGYFTSVKVHRARLYKNAPGGKALD